MCLLFYFLRVCDLGEEVEKAQPSEIVIWDLSFEAVFL